MYIFLVINVLASLLLDVHAETTPEFWVLHTFLFVFLFPQTDENFEKFTELMFLLVSVILGVGILSFRVLKILV